MDCFLNRGIVEFLNLYRYKPKIIYLCPLEKKCTNGETVEKDCNQGRQ
jgi:hypothetical protein